MGVQGRALCLSATRMATHASQHHGNADADGHRGRTLQFIPDGTKRNPNGNAR